MKQYSILLFDADDTLFDFAQCERAALLDALASMNITLVGDMVEVYSRINDRMWKMLERGEIDKTSLRLKRFEEFARHFELDVDAEGLSVCYTDHLSKKAFLVDGAYDALQALSKHHRLFLITNGIGYVQRGRLALSPIKDFFEDVFISEELGAEKPQKAFFDKMAASISDFSAERALIIGDSLTSDMKGGIATGIDTCWFNPKGKAKPDGMPITYTISSLAELLLLGELA